MQRYTNSGKLASVDSDVSASLEAVRAGAPAASLESERLDFKQDDAGGEKATARAITYAAICFANAQGGNLVLGVADLGAGPDAFVGTELEPSALKRRIWETSEPGLTVDIEQVVMSEARLLVVRVPESSQIHSDTSGRAPRRIATDCHNMSAAEQERLREDRGGVDWSKRPSSHRPAEVSRAAIALAAENLSRHVDPERRRLATLAPADLLRRLGAVSADGRLTRAGEVLFCSAPEGSDRLVYTYKESTGGEATNVERFGGPLVEAFEAVVALVQARRKVTPLTLPTGQQLQIEDFPQLALREALSNGVLHRDYNLSDPVRVTHSPHALEVTSPGPLVAGVTQSNILTHDSKPRNRALAQAARMLGLAEELGAGVDRMYRELLSSGKEIPIIEADSQRVRVTFVGRSRSSRLPAYIAQLPSTERKDVDALLILVRLCDVAWVDAATIAPVLQKPTQSAQISLERLAADPVAMVEPTRGTARSAEPRYRLREELLQQLGPAVSYHHRRSADEVDRKVAAHVREYGKITNKTVRNIFSVDVQRAKTMLSELVQRELLIKTSDAQRGPTVEYGPGPRFPRQKQRRAARRTRP